MTSSAERTSAEAESSKLLHREDADGSPPAPLRGGGEGGGANEAPHQCPRADSRQEEMLTSDWPPLNTTPPPVNPSNRGRAHPIIFPRVSTRLVAFDHVFPPSADTVFV